jgi:hypothetical protein
MGEGKMSVVFIDKAEGNVCGYDKLTFFLGVSKKTRKLIKPRKLEKK